MTSVDAKGRIVLPSAVREKLGLRPGSELTVSTADGRVILEPETDPAQVVDELETLIDGATANRERRHNEGKQEGSPPGVDDDPIAAKQLDIIERGAARDERDSPDNDI